MRYSNLIFIVLIILISFQSCRYSSPLIMIRIQKRDYSDSLSNYKRAEKTFIYFSLRRFALLGMYSTEKEFINGKKKKIIHSKKTPAFMWDGWVRNSTMTTFYDDNGKKTQIDKKVFQHSGIGGEYKVNKSVYFDKGKKRKTDNRINKNNG